MNKIIQVAGCGVVFLAMSGLLVLPAAADQLYKWVDSQGNVTYQSSPPPDSAAKIEKSKIKTGNNAVKDETADAGKKEVKTIILYSKPDCETCKEASDYFAANAIPFEEIDLSENTDAAAELKEKLGFENLPTFSINDKFITGFEKSMMKKILVNEGYSLPKDEEEL